MLCEQQQYIHDMRGVMNTMVGHMRNERMSVNITTNKSSNSIPDEVRRNELDFQIGCTTSTHTSCSLL